jgi:hypothetical protein
MLFFKLSSEASERVLSADSTYKSSDSCIVFVTTRTVKIENGQHSFGNTIAKDGHLRFYNIYFKGSELKIAPRHSLAEALNNANISTDFMVYTEGHGKMFSDNLERGINTTRLYSINVIMFDWPSKVPGYRLQKNFYNSIHNSKSVAKQFNELLLQLGDYKNNEGKEKMQHLSMFFHSMGNYVLLSTLKKFGSQNYNNDLVDNIIFNAPCVPSRGHDKLFEQLDFQKNIYVMYNKKDPALKGATILLGKFLLGTRPIRFAKNAHYFNLKPVARVSHNCFLRQSILTSRPEVHDLYTDLFHSRPLNLSDVCVESVGGTNNFKVF